MNTPLDPNRPPIPAESSNPPKSAAFSAALGRSAALRIGVVGAAVLVLLVSAALAFGASPEPSAPGAAPGTPGDGGGPRLHDGGIGGPRLGLRFDGGRGHHGFGDITIAAIDGSNLSLRTDDGWTRTITVTGTTKITRAGATIALGDLEVGDHIRFRQTRNSDGTFAVQAIEVVLPRIAGEVTAVTADGFTLRTRGNVSWTIAVNDATRYMLGTATGSKADVKVGSRVAVAGDQTGDAALTASVVRVAVPHVVGRVTAKTADTITIERFRGGTVTIHVSGSTTYRVPGKEDASLADIAVGTIVGAEGSQRADGSIEATAVRAAPKLGRLFDRRDGLTRPKKGPNLSPNATPGSYSVG